MPPALPPTFNNIFIRCRLKEEYHKWFTEYLEREFELLVFGHDGIPVILFPTSQGRYYENKDFKLIESAARLLDSGKIKIYCPDGIDSDSWYNYSIHPADRVKTHNAYEQTVLNDIIEFAIYETGEKKVCAAGCSLGAYHAANIAFRHPDKVNSLICMGGSFDIKQFIMGYYDDNCYFNNPPDYMPNLDDVWYLDRIKQMKIIIGTGEFDKFKDESTGLSRILWEKGIEHTLEVLPGAEHDWPAWRDMFPRYLDNITTA